MANLFPLNYDANDEAIVTPQSTPDPGYRYSSLYDLEIGDMSRSGGNQIVQATGEEAWKNWCVKNIQTPRFACLAYTSNYGVDILGALNSPTRSTAESIITREVTEAIMADPYKRTQAVNSITFEWICDTEIIVNVELTGIDGQTADITATLGV